MEIRRTDILLLLLLPVLIGSVRAQDTHDGIPYLEQAQKRFEYGILQYQASAWHNAARLFEGIARDLPPNHRSTAAYVMAARAHLRDGKASTAIRLIEELHRGYPESSYLAEAFLVAGDAAVAAGSRSSALRWYLRSWQDGRGDRVLLERKIQALRPEEVPPGERRLVREVLSASSDSALLSLLGWDVASASASAEDVRRERPLPNNQMRPARIAAALPLHESDFRRAGLVRDLRDGMLAALDLHREAQRTAVEFELIDSGDVDSLQRAIDRLERDDRVIALIGGAFSEDAETVSRLAAEKGMLVLLPTATADGLTRFGSNIFQLNLPISQRATLLADFAYLELDAQEAVVIAPAKSYARDMADVFIRRCEDIGIRVTLGGYYGEGGEDIAKVCRRAVQAGVKNGILFAPVSNRDDIVGVLRGMQESRNSMPVVGGGNWNHPDLITENAAAFPLYFESDVAADTTSTAYGRLRTAFGRRSSRPLSREALFGHDAMRIALDVAGRTNSTRMHARKHIINVFEGLRAPVNFLDRRINSAMNIIMYRAGKIQKHEAFHSK